MFFIFMIIGVDAGALSIADERLKVGVWHVTYNLLRELGQIDTTNTYRLYSFAPIERGVMKEFGPKMRNIVLAPSIGWSFFRLPLELQLHPVDVFLGLAQSLPSSKSYNIDCRNVLTNVLQSHVYFPTPKKSSENKRNHKTMLIGFIYDLAFLYAPDAYGPAYKQLKNQTDQMVTRADQIITISQSSKTDIISHYKIPSEKVLVCYPGVDGRFTKTNKMDSCFRGNDMGNRYFLFVGSLNKAKDLPLAIESFAYFLKKIQKLYDFLLIGGDYWPDPRIDESIHKYSLEGRVKKLGFVSDETLPEYYRGATAFFTTAIREGFCLPAVEALSCGTPVISVNRGAMKEVVSDAGRIAKDIQPETIAGELFAMATKSHLRTTLSMKAIKRAKSFSWRKFATCIYDHMVTR